MRDFKENSNHNYSTLNIESINHSYDNNPCLKGISFDVANGEIISLLGPSGSGKTTIAKILFKELPFLSETISYTTRKKREEEQNGREYHFITKEKFEEMIKNGEFIEYEKIYENYYGTSYLEIERLKKLNKSIIMLIDTNGALKIKNNLSVIYYYLSYLLYPSN